MGTLPSEIRIRIGLLLLTVALATPSEGAAQWPPERFTNLQVLPQDISLGELVAVMRGFASDLGVRCNHCHVGTEPDDLSTFQFASDEKYTKRKAREMLRMVQAINGTHLASLEVRTSPPIEVTCATCHHGVTLPRSIHEILLTKARNEDAQAALEEYTALREEYYGSYSYDFSNTVLSSVAEELAETDPEGAIELLKANGELFPEFMFNHYSLGELYEHAADTTSAVAHFREALAIDPGNRWVIGKLEGLGAEP